MSNFDLIITVDYPNRRAELRLLDAHGSQLAFRQVDFRDIAVSRQQGLFNLREYLRHYVEPGQKAASVVEIGVCIAEEVLGAGIFDQLWQSQAQRTLRIMLPGATQEENHLAAALARVPWEIACPTADQPTLAERNLLVRVVHDMAEPATQPLALAPDESLRLLFVFAESRGSRPLAARRERLELLRVFEKEIYPQRRIVADFLTHGVTRRRLEAQIQENSGYHVVHWSGHGHLNLLELAKPDGAPDFLSGEDLLGLFIKAGGFIPRLFFLSACHSGDILQVKDWNDFLAIAQGEESVLKEPTAAGAKDTPFEAQPGYTGTAHALIQGGVPSVVAMRYAVGDDYARELAIEFYRALLAHHQPKTAAAALTMARRSLLNPEKYDLSRYDVCDHATPVLYGADQPGLALQPGRSPALEVHHRRLHQITELTSAGHQHFVGRTWELAGLGAEFIGSQTGGEEKPVALITGLGGMGKTALVAETLALWESRFQWILLYQAKPNPLSFEATLRDIDLQLRGELGRYHDHVKSHPADAIYRAGDTEFTGKERLERLTHNLLRALGDEPILLVLDNFETNLKPQAEPAAGAGEPLWVCQDPAWDRCLAELAANLGGTPSRVLITSRQPLAALAGTACHQVLLGPLPPGEAALYLREHTGLSRMVFSSDAGEKVLALRLLQASRFHTLLLDRLARLATGGPELRPQFLQALETLEGRQDYDQLPALFATGAADAKELAYLEDALAASLDQLISTTAPEARLLLWLLAVANEPVTFGLLRGVWSGESHKNEKLRKIREMLEMLEELPPELQAKLPAMPPELRAEIDALPSSSVRPDPAPLLTHLVAVGLATEERAGPEDDNPELTCHELVRERIGKWMEEHPQDRQDLTENAIRLAYAERLEALFKTLQHKNMTTALQAGSRALIYCVQAGAYDRLGGFASAIVTSAKDPRLLESLLPHLEAAATSAPDGKPRWSCLCSLADAMMSSGRDDTSLAFYEQAATQARTATTAPGENGRQAWLDLAVITGNWSNALWVTGDLDASRHRQIEAAKAYKNGGAPPIYVIGRELEALRLDIMQGLTAQAQPQVEKKLKQVEAWWRKHRAGKRVPEAPDPEFITRAFISALDIAKAAHFAKGEWESALSRIDTTIEVERAVNRPAEDLACTRGNRAVVLSRLGRFGEAQAELEACLQVFQNDPANKAKTLAALALLFSQQGDVAQAITQQRRALALCEQLPNPDDRATFHHNLALYLILTNDSSAIANATRHQLAALIYQLVSELGQGLQTSLHNYAIDFDRARAAGKPLTVPRMAELLADPAFRPLADWLLKREVNVANLQAEVDQFLEQARQKALEED